MSAYSQFIPLPLSPSSGGLGLSQAQTVVATSGAINNLAIPTGWIRFTGSLPVLSGLSSTGIAEGTEVTLYNANSSGGQFISVLAESALSTAANRFTTAFSIQTQEAVKVKYNATASRWEVVTQATAWETNGNSLPTGSYRFGTTSTNASLSMLCGNTTFFSGSNSSREFLDNSNIQVMTFATGLRRLLDSSGVTIFDFHNCVLYNPNDGFIVFDLISRVINDSTGGIIFDINNASISYAGMGVLDGVNRRLFDTSNNQSLDFSLRRLTNGAAFDVLDWYAADITISTNVLMGSYNLTANQINASYLSNSLNQPLIDMNSFIYYDNSFVSAITTLYRQLIDVTGSAVALDWAQRTLVDSVSTTNLDWEGKWLLHVGTTVLNWATQDLNDTTAALSLNWELRTCYDSTGLNSILWQDRRLAASTGQSFVDWATAQELQVIGKLMLGGAFEAPAAKLHLDSGNAQASAIKLTAGTTTGKTSTDGFDVGITTTGVAELRQRENLALELYTANTLRAQWSGAGNLFLAGTTQARGGSGSASVPFWSFEASTGTGMYRAGTDILGFATSGGLRAQIAANGKMSAYMGGVAMRGIVTTCHTNITAVGNVGAGEDDLMSTSLSGSTLNNNGECIHFKASGTFAANANNKRIKVKFGATTIFDTTALALNAGDWSVVGEIVRTSTTSQKCTVRWQSSNATLAYSIDYATAAENILSAVTFKFTGEATSNNDIVQEYLLVSWEPIS